MTDVGLFRNGGFVEWLLLVYGSVSHPGRARLHTCRITEQIAGQIYSTIQDTKFVKT